MAEDGQPEKFGWISLVDQAQISQCVNCKHNRGELVEGRPTCDAFPLGIPENILQNKYWHDKKHPSQAGDGDEVITYEPAGDSINLIEKMKESETDENT